MRKPIYGGVAAARSAMLTAAAILGTVCLLATLIAPLVGMRPLIFLSGSMSPTIPAGSLALARVVDAADIGVNDIVTVRSNGTYLTHRVVEVTHAPGKATLLLRGDGNKAVDAKLYEVTSAPKVRLWIPHVGTIVAWFSHAPGVYVLAGWVALVLGSVRRHREAGSQRPRPPSWSGRPKVLLVARRKFAGPGVTRGARLARGASVAATVVAAPLAAPPSAAANWADSVAVTGTSISTVTPTAPVASCSSVTSSMVTVSWTARSAATGYRLYYGDLNSPTVEDVPASTLTKSFANRVDGRFKVRTLYGGSWISGYSNELRYDTSGQGSCV